MRKKAKRRLFAAVIVWTGAVAASAESASASKPKPSAVQQNRASSIELFIKNLLDYGKDGTLVSFLVPIHHLEPDPPMKYFVVKPDHDGHGVKACDLVVDKSSHKPRCIILYDVHKVGSELISHSYRLNLNGGLESANQGVSKYDSSGKIIRGSAINTELNLTAESTKQDMQKQLGFWMSGEYKKYLAAAETKTLASAKIEPGPAAAPPQQAAP